MGFFKNINATPRLGTIIMHPDGVSIYTENGWHKYTNAYISTYNAISAPDAVIQEGEEYTFTKVENTTMIF